MIYNHKVGVIKPFIKEHTGFFTAGVAVIFAFTWYFAMFGNVSAAETTTVVDQFNTDWGFLIETGSGEGELVLGPGATPLGNGSAELRTDDGSDGIVFGTQAFGGTKLADFEALSYQTYVQTGNNLIAPAIQFYFDDDVSDMDGNFKGRLVFEPYLNDVVIDGKWQTWDAASEDAVWWTTWGGTTECKHASPCTESELLALWPNAGTNNGALESFLFKAGSGWSDTFVGNIDNLRVGLAGNVSVFDFGLDFVDDKDECKKGGWEKGLVDRTFKNQGDCVSHFASNGNR